MKGQSASRQSAESRRKFLHLFPEGFRDERYLEWERNYKWRAHTEWEADLNCSVYGSLLREGKHRDIAARAIRIESRTNLLFSFEKMAIRDAVRSLKGAGSFAEGLFVFLHGLGTRQKKFKDWCEVLAALPRKQTRIDLACGDGFWIHCTAEDSYLS
jgi:hypothetical protein